MIRPTIGRMLWYYPGGAPSLDAGVQPLSAQVAYVHSDTCVNIGFLNPNGVAGSATSVSLIQDDTPAPNYPFCMWMPYQKGQAARTEQLERQATGEAAGS